MSTVHRYQTQTDNEEYNLKVSSQVLYQVFCYNLKNTNTTVNDFHIISLALLAYMIIFYVDYQTW